jgi:hypothetical protein
MKRHIVDEANARLAFYLPLPPEDVPPPGIDIPPRPQLPDGVVDMPLVRLFNFLRTSFCLALFSATNSPAYQKLCVYHIN